MAQLVDGAVVASVVLAAVICLWRMRRRTSSTSACGACPAVKKH